MKTREKMSAMSPEDLVVGREDGDHGEKNRAGRDV